ncbi:MAG: PorT family protein [Bacteroidaceae bacterium]|nr:PorT family protein [Bacteroidaceae bacterium]
MKKLFFAAAVLMCSLTAFAQSKEGTFNILPKAGINISNLSNKDNAKVKVGFTAGAEAEYQLTKQLSLSAGALFSMQGAKSTTVFREVDNTTKEIREVDIKNTMEFDYINVPILANYYIIEGLAVKLGIQPGFNIVAKRKRTDGVDKVSENLKNLGVDVRKVDFSIPIGISYELNDFVVDARFNLGLTEVADLVKSKNRVFQITFGYQIDL